MNQMQMKESEQDLVTKLITNLHLLCLMDGNAEKIITTGNHYAFFFPSHIILQHDYKNRGDFCDQYLTHVRNGLQKMK